MNLGFPLQKYEKNQPVATRHEPTKHEPTKPPIQPDGMSQTNANEPPTSVELLPRRSKPRHPEGGGGGMPINGISQRWKPPSGDSVTVSDDGFGEVT